MSKAINYIVAITGGPNIEHDDITYVFFDGKTYSLKKCGSHVAKRFTKSDAVNMCRRIRRRGYTCNPQQYYG